MPDHKLRLKLRFESTTQQTTLLDYQEQYQRIVSVMTFADVLPKAEDLVLQFIWGLKKEEDRHTLIQQNCQTMEAVYTAIMQIRQSKAIGAQVR